MVQARGRKYSVDHVICRRGRRSILVTKHFLCDGRFGRRTTAVLLEFSGGGRGPRWLFMRKGEESCYRVTPGVDLHFGV